MDGSGGTRLAPCVLAFGGDPMSERPITVYGAMAANAVIAAAKLVAAVLSGSSAMVAEGVHSIVDTGNEALLLLGIRRSRRAPDEAHPFGYGKELYFWSLLVAVVLFAIGGGFSLYEGVHRLGHPLPEGDPRWSYFVLAVALVAETASWLIAARALSRSEGSGILAKFRRSKDPSHFLVFAEDSAALLGIAVAFAGVVTGQLLHSRTPDAIASVLIGVILTAVSVYLVIECRHLLLGEGMDPASLRTLQAVIRSKPYVVSARRPLTMYFGPSEVLVNLELSFEPRRSSAQIARDIEDLEDSIRAACPEVKRIFVEAQSLRPERAGGEEREARS
jgi:cation diffusion facilitator family transporter